MIMNKLDIYVKLEIVMISVIDVTKIVVEVPDRLAWGQLIPCACICSISSEYPINIILSAKFFVQFHERICILGCSEI